MHDGVQEAALRLAEGEGITLELRALSTKNTCHQRQPANERRRRPFLDCAGVRDGAHLIQHRLNSGIVENVIRLPCNTKRHSERDKSIRPDRVDHEDPRKMKMERNKVINLDEHQVSVCGGTQADGLPR